MANEIAQRLGYTNREAVSGKHIAMNMSLTNAIRMGLVVNPKLVSCAYSLKTDGSLDELKDRIEQIEDIQERNEKLEEYESLRRKVESAEGIPEILQADVKKDGKYIVFLPLVEDLEDEDGNVIGRKKGKEKLEYWKKQIEEYFKGSEIKPNFHSMLGEYGDKENARRLEEFQNSNTEETEFMLVINKANEGLHIDKLDGIIWLRTMDKNSRILYLQQLGRVIYSEDPDNPTKYEDRPVVIDLVNNTLKVNWENEITEQDDIQMLNLILDWTERHDGTLPNINSTDKEETGYSRVLKEIQGKYKEYLKSEFDGLNEKQVEEIKKIISLGSQVNLWQIDLPERVLKQGERQSKSFESKTKGPFEITGLLKDFVEIEDKVEGKTIKSIYEQVIEFVETHGRQMKSSFYKKNDKALTREEMTKEQKEEVNLYASWHNTNEYKILREYAGQPIGDVPEEYREKIATLRKYGLEPKLKQEKTIYEQVIDFIEIHGRIMRGSLGKNGKVLTREDMTEEQKEEVNLYYRWRRSEEYKILREYEGQPIESVPEECREKITTLRKFGIKPSPRQKKEKSIYEQVIEFIETHGRIMRWPIGKNGKVLTIEEMTEEQRQEKRLYIRWHNSKEYKILREYARQPIESVPEEHREKIATLRKYGLEQKLKQEETIYEQVIEFIEKHGRIMRGSIGKNGKVLTRDEMTEEQKEEVNLYDRWIQSKEYKILRQYAEQSIENVPEEYREKIATLREYGIEPRQQQKQEKTTYEQVIEFIETHGRIMKSAFLEKGKALTKEKMTEEQNKEVNLHAMWRRTKEYKILQEYAGQPIGDVPEEYREKIAILRKYRIEPRQRQKKEKSIYEQVIEFVEKHGRQMKGNFYQKRKALTREEMTEEQIEESNLYQRWRRTNEYKILQEYAEQPIENVPEEYRAKIATLRKHGIEPKQQRKITSQQLAEASIISSLTNPEMADKVDAELKALVEKAKEKGGTRDEQP